MRSEAVNRARFDESLRRLQEGRLTARPRIDVNDAEARKGLRPLGLGNGRDGYLYVPESYRPGHPAPLVLMLHGSGADALNGLGIIRKLADEAGVLVLAVDSRDYTWDLIASSYGPDVAFLDDALAWTFERYAVDASRVAIGGFSDGASYALSLGLANGALFSHVIAFSPGFASPPGEEGSPRLYVSHGTRDRVLPIDRCSRRLVPMLQHGGYAVRYHEFDGPHTVPAEVAREALDWFLATREG